MDSSLWNFAVSLYGKPGVAKECLALQDRFGLNVNLLLLGIYLGSEFEVSLSGEEVAAAACAIAQWQMQVVNPLRDVRRFLKQTSARNKSRHGQSTESLRTRVKNAELASERLEAAMLTEWYQPRLSGWLRGDRKTAIVGNCRTVLVHCGAGQTELPQRLITRALAL